MAPTPVTDKCTALGMRNRYTFATIEVTGRCNASCAYCYVKNNEAADLSTEQLFSIIDKLIDHGVMHLLITGGEPFLRPDILDVLQYAIDKDIWHITLYTNGTLLTAEHLAFLQEHARIFTQIQLSLFSHDAAINDAYFGVPGASDTILRSAKAIQTMGIPLQIALNVLEETLDTFMDTAAMLNSLHLDVAVSHNTLLNPDPLLAGRLDVESIEQKQSLEYLLMVQNRIDIKQQEINQQRFTNPPAPATPLDQTHPCIGLQTTIAISYEGIILPCNAMRQYPIGTIFDPRPLTDILNASTALARLKAMMISDITPCGTCSHVSACRHCAAAMMAWTGTFNTKADHGCNWARAVIKSTGSPVPVLPNRLGFPCP